MVRTGLSFKCHLFQNLYHCVFHDVCPKTEMQHIHPSLLMHMNAAVLRSCNPCFIIGSMELPQK